MKNLFKKQKRHGVTTSFRHFNTNKSYNPCPHKEKKNKIKSKKQNQLYQHQIFAHQRFVFVKQFWTDFMLICVLCNWHCFSIILPCFNNRHKIEMTIINWKTIVNVLHLTNVISKLINDSIVIFDDVIILFSTHIISFFEWIVFCFRRVIEFAWRQRHFILMTSLWFFSNFVFTWIVQFFKITFHMSSNYDWKLKRTMNFIFFQISVLFNQK